MDDTFVDGHAAFRSFDQSDLEAWLVSGASKGGFEDDLRAVLRAQFLCAAIGSSFGPDIARGLADEELGAALALAARPSLDQAEHGAKRVALRFHASSRSSAELVAAMVHAALDHDERRLAQMTTSDTCAPASPTRTLASPESRAPRVATGPARARSPRRASAQAPQR